MTRILINFALIFTITFCILQATHSTTAHDNIRNTRRRSIDTLQSPNFIQLTDLRRPILIAQNEIANDTCEPSCEEFDAVEDERSNNYTGLSGLNCHGWFDSCRNFGIPADEKNPATYCYTKKEKHLIWTKEESVTEFRNSTEECTEKPIPLPLQIIENQECKVCLCMCTEDSNDPKSITNWAFSLLPQQSDIDNNRVVTGVRIQAHEKLIYLQIEENEINSDDEGDWKPFNLPKNLVPEEDYSLLEPKSRTLNVDMIHVQHNEVVTGVRFTKLPSYNKRSGALRLEVQGTKFDTKTGKLIKNSSTWYNSDSSAKTNKLITFEPADRANDNGQLTIPYLSTRNVQSEKKKIVNGIGLFYEESKDFGGFIAPKISNDNRFNGKIISADEISTIEENNFGIKPPKGEEEEEEDWYANRPVKPEMNEPEIKIESTSTTVPSTTGINEENEETSTQKDIMKTLFGRLTSFFGPSNSSSDLDTNKEEEDMIQTPLELTTSRIDHFEQNSPTEGSTMKMIVETTTQGFTGINFKEKQDNISREHMKKENTTVGIIDEKNKTMENVKESENLVKPQVEDHSSSATTLKIHIMFYVITLLVIISLV